MKEIPLINIKEEILSENKGLADRLRTYLTSNGVFFLNIMGSPGSGKTSLILKTLEAIGNHYRTAVIEADIDSLVDSEKVADAGTTVIQLHTGGFCHVDANMVEKALESLRLDEFEVVILENVGNLVCPAETDTGAFLNVCILSVPEGDDKPLKYPLMFTVSDVLVINKMDYLGMSDFNVEKIGHRAKALNKSIQLFPVSCKTSAGLNVWTDWLMNEIGNFMKQKK